MIRLQVSFGPAKHTLRLICLNEIHCRIAISQFFESYGRTRACAQRADANWACGFWPVGAQAGLKRAVAQAGLEATMTIAKMPL